jgi:hypothetical protein
MPSGLGQYTLSEPIPIHWMGWETDTLRLAHHGWQISASEHFERDELTVAFQHEESDIRGITYAEKWNYRRLLDPYHGGWDGAPTRTTGLKVDRMGRQIFTRQAFGVDDMRWRPVDPYPQMRPIDRPKRIDDFVHFAPVVRKQIILPPESVPELMEKILKLQQPMREEHFREQVRNARANATLHAQIISLAG